MFELLPKELWTQCGYQQKVIAAFGKKINKILRHLNAQEGIPFDKKPEEKVSIVCPDCNSVEHPSGICKVCNSTGIQQTGLTKEQAKLALDEGWIVQSYTQKENYYFIHNKNIYAYLGHLNEVILSTGYENGIEPFKIKCRAVETRENLKTWEALKLNEEGWDISYDDNTHGTIHIMANKQADYCIDLGVIWTATRRNYPLPKEDK